MWWYFIFGCTPNFIFWGLCAIVGAWGYRINRLNERLEILEFNKDMNNHRIQCIYRDIEKLTLASGTLVLTPNGVKEKYNGK